MAPWCRAPCAETATAPHADVHVPWLAARMRHVPMSADGPAHHRRIPRPRRAHPCTARCAAGVGPRWSERHSDRGSRSCPTPRTPSTREDQPGRSPH
eukprot:7175460-Prymnesium_polylepis.2